MPAEAFEAAPEGTPEELDEETPEETPEEILEAWREVTEFSTEQFEELLTAQGLDRKQLAQLLTEREQVPKAEPEPAWQEMLRAVLRRMGDGRVAPSPTPAALEGPPFATVLDSFVAVAWDDLRARVARPTAFDIDWAALAPRLQANLRTLLLRICQRTLVLELNVARLRGLLEGETPAARYAYYVDTLRKEPSVWLQLFDEYQVMARLLGTTMELWVAGLVELLGRLVADYPRLTEGAGALLPARRRLCLVELAGGLSDPHRGGRGVWKLAFTDGGASAASHRLVYKPRSLAVDVHFQALLEFCNQGARRGALHLADLQHATLPTPAPSFPALRLLRLLDCGDHGWVEHVPRHDCEDARGAARFYVRQGAYLALLYLLDGADIHSENVIASGEHPMLVDLETLFHPWLAMKPEDEADEAAASDARGRAIAMLRGSVMRTALLPGRMWGDRDRAGVNIGGLGDGRAQLSPRASLTWTLAGTDDMHAAEQRFEVPPGDNVPRVDGKAMPVSHRVEELVAGFEAMMRFLIAEREVLLAPGGAIHAFAGAPMRRLLRATSAYAHLIEPSCHPDHLRDAMHRERLLDLLWKVSQGRPRLLRVFPTEKEDLRHGDIPYFCARPDSRDLWDSRGDRIPDFFDVPALETVTSNLRAAGGHEIAEQVFVIRAAVTATSIASPAPGERAPSPLPRCGQTALDAAIAIGERIEARAIRGAHDATWLGMDSTRDGAGVEVAPLRGGLYDGTGGIALFLGYLGHMAREERFTHLARRAALATRTQLLDAGEDPSGFSGTLSHLYVLSHLAALWDDGALVPPLGPIFERVTAQVSASERFDVIYGAAGCVLALLAIHALTGDEQALAAAAVAGQRLVAGSVRGAAGASWPCTVSTRHLLGFSHGASGAGAALVRLSRAVAGHSGLGVDAAALAELGQAAFDFERSHFVASAGNWPDLREEAGGTDEAPRFALAYCHGAPGIALARLSALPLLPDAPARRDAEIAIATTLASPLQLGQTLCHGELGNLMIVHRAAALLGRDDWQREVDRRLGVTLARLFERGPRCSFDFAPAAPALMDGVAGIGYGLLYLTRPAELPFVLDLSPLAPLAPLAPR
jgi:type 2 lantibiotic biosynthesis protein LanM